jgi:hypothetical protein
VDEIIGFASEKPKRDKPKMVEAIRKERETSFLDRSIF